MERYIKERRPKMFTLSDIVSWLKESKYVHLGRLLGGVNIIAAKKLDAKITRKMKQFYNADPDMVYLFLKSHTELVKRSIAEKKGWPLDAMLKVLRREGADGVVCESEDEAADDDSVMDDDYADEDEDDEEEGEDGGEDGVEGDDGGGNGDVGGEDARAYPDMNAEDVEYESQEDELDKAERLAEEMEREERVTRTRRLRRRQAPRDDDADADDVYDDSDAVPLEPGSDELDDASPLGDSDVEVGGSKRQRLDDAVLAELGRTTALVNDLRADHASLHTALSDIRARLDQLVERQDTSTAVAAIQATLAQQEQHIVDGRARIDAMRKDVSALTRVVRDGTTHMTESIGSMLAAMQEARARRAARAASVPTSASATQEAAHGAGQPDTAEQQRDVPDACTDEVPLRDASAVAEGEQTEACPPAEAAAPTAAIACASAALSDEVSDAALLTLCASIDMENVSANTVMSVSDDNTSVVDIDAAALQRQPTRGHVSAEGSLDTELGRSDTVPCLTIAEGDDEAPTLGDGGVATVCAAQTEPERAEAVVEAETEQGAVASEAEPQQPAPASEPVVAVTSPPPQLAATAAADDIDTVKEADYVEAFSAFDDAAALNGDALLRGLNNWTEMRTRLTHVAKSDKSDEADEVREKLGAVRFPKCLTAWSEAFRTLIGCLHHNPKDGAMYPTPEMLKRIENLNLAHFLMQRKKLTLRRGLIVVEPDKWTSLMGWTNAVIRWALMYLRTSALAPPGDEEDQSVFQWDWIQQPNLRLEWGIVGPHEEAAVTKDHPRCILVDETFDDLRVLQPGMRIARVTLAYDDPTSKKPKKKHVYVTDKGLPVLVAVWDFLMWPRIITARARSLAGERDGYVHTRCLLPDALRATGVATSLSASKSSLAELWEAIVLRLATLLWSNDLALISKGVRVKPKPKRGDKGAAKSETKGKRRKHTHDGEPNKEKGRRGKRARNDDEELELAWSRGASSKDADVAEDDDGAAGGGNVDDDEEEDTLGGGGDDNDSVDEAEEEDEATTSDAE